jgi:hypothetical protein
MRRISSNVLAIFLAHAREVLLIAHDELLLDDI